MSGFIYRGIHSSKFGCYYIPDALNRGSDMAAFDVEDLDAGYQDGGLHVCTRVKTRDFVLDCYFEGITIQMREGQMQWLHRNSMGTLVYDQRPHVYYDVRPAKRIEIKQYEHRENDETLYSGTFTITFRCYDPYGKLYTNSYTDTCTPQLLASTGIFPQSMMPQKPSTSDNQFLLYNCGTEKAPLIIRLAGDVGNGLSIKNETTGQVCRIVSLQANDIPPKAYLEINSETGQVWLVKGPDRELAFYYHDMGYLQLAPCTPFLRNLEIHHSSGERQITSSNGFTYEMAGQYVNLSGQWMEIRQVDNENTAQLHTAAPSTGSTETPIVTMNKICLDGEGIELSLFEVDFIPRVK